MDTLARHLPSLRHMLRLLRWLTPWRSRRPRGAQPSEPADLGTAFGLDAAIDPDLAGPIT